MKLADRADKDIWLSKFQRLTADLEDVSQQKDVLAQNNKSNNIENLPRPDQLEVFKTWNVILDKYVNTKKYGFGFLSIFESSYLREQVFSNINCIKTTYRYGLTDNSLQSCMKIKEHHTALMCTCWR